MIKTRSMFYYGFQVTAQYTLLAFDEGSGELTASLKPGFYSSAQFMIEVKRAMEEVGENDYSVTFDRVTRQVTISSPDPFDLLTNSGTGSGQGPYETLGFSSLVDLTGTNTYTSDGPCGKSYRPQLMPQSYVSTDQKQKSVDATVNISTSGKVEVVRFGVSKFMSLELMYITNRLQPVGSVIESDPSAIENYLSFIQYAVQKAYVEFMPDRDRPDLFQVFILEKTDEDDKGTGYMLTEEYARGLDGYHKSGKLEFRLQE